MPVNSFENYPMSWKPSLKNIKGSITKGLAKLLEEDIKNCKLNPGTKLPPQRELADFLDINLSTVTRAFKLCEEKGLICATIGKGTFVSSDVHIKNTMMDTLERGSLIELGASHPTYEQNEYVVKTIQEIMNRPDSYKLLEYKEVNGSSYQKSVVCKFLKEEYKLPCNEEDILFAAGGQNALCSILLSLFNSGDKIGVDPLIYAGLKTSANMCKIKLISIGSDEEGMSAKSLDTICKNEKLTGIYLINDIHNPTTKTMSEKRREEIRKISQKHNLLIIEDGIHRLLLDNLSKTLYEISHNTIYIASMSKIICPGLRVGMIITPQKYKKDIQFALYNMNVMVSNLQIEALCSIINNQVYKSIINERKETIKNRMKIAEYILNKSNCNYNKGGNLIWLKLPNNFNSKDFEVLCKEKGVQVYCSERFVVGNEDELSCIRLCITAPHNEEQLKKGLNIIVNLINRYINKECRLSKD